MQAVRLSSFAIVIDNLRFPFFRAYCFACNDTELFLWLYKDCNLIDLSFKDYCPQLDAGIYLILLHGVLIIDSVRYLWFCAYCLALILTLWYDFLAVQNITYIATWKWPGPAFSSLWDLVRHFHRPVFEGSRIFQSPPLCLHFAVIVSIPCVCYIVSYSEITIVSFVFARLSATTKLLWHHVTFLSKLREPAHANTPKRHTTDWHIAPLWFYPQQWRAHIQGGPKK